MRSGLQAGPIRPRPRRLPLSLPPARGEAFAGYVERVAADLAVPVSLLMVATAIVDDVRRLTLPFDYGVDLPTARIERFAHSLGLEPARVRMMLLTNYVGVVFEPMPLRIREGGGRRRARMTGWSHLPGSHFCPRCLGESGEVIWRLAWKLPWSFACVRHRCLLIDTCPSCGGRTGPRRPDRRNQRLTRVPEPGLCGNPLPARLAGHGQRGRPCGEALADLEPLDLELFPELLAVQRLFDAALQGRPPSLASGPVTSVEFFGLLRSLGALILYAAEPRDLGEVPHRALAAFADRLGDRTATDRASRELTGTRPDTQVGRPIRCYSRVPRKAALMGAIAPLALRILTAEPERRLAEAIAPLVMRSQERSPRDARRIPGMFSFSPELVGAYQANLERMGPIGVDDSEPGAELVSVLAA